MTPDPEAYTGPPRLESQHEGEGYSDALDLMKSIGQRAPAYALQDTLTRTVVVVMPAMPTGDPAIVWTQNKVDGLRKFSVAALVGPRFIRTKTVSLSGDSVIQVTGDSPAYQRARAVQPEDSDE